MTTPSAPPTPPTAPHGWTTETTVGDAGPFHLRPVPDEADHQIWVHHVQRSALVLGSTQSDDLVDQARAEADGVEVCRRRSGGGIVPLSPGHECWIDVIVPRHSPLWNDDVGQAFDWLGRVWAATIAASTTLGVNPEVYAGPLLGGAAGKLVCFASLGPGEVTVAGRKVVGISQRRTRTAARFQAIAVGEWRPALVERYVDAEALQGAGIDPSSMAAGLEHGPWPPAAELAAEFCRRLPDV